MMVCWYWIPVAAIAGACVAAFALALCKVAGREK